MAWEYLDALDYRFARAGRYIHPQDRVVDVNSGNSHLRNYVENYISNDLNDERADCRVTDDVFMPMVKECDVLCLFGIGGHEITKEVLESSTVTDSVITLAIKYRPRLLILECVNDFVEIAERIMRETEYVPMRTYHDVVELEQVPEFVKHRTMYICKNLSIWCIKISHTRLSVGTR
jgi:hypothetical protein